MQKRGVAQLVARGVRDAEVVGSSPVASTKILLSTPWIGGFFVGAMVVKNPRITAGSCEQRPQTYIEKCTKIVGVATLWRSQYPVASTKILLSTPWIGGFFVGAMVVKNPRITVGSCEQRPQIYIGKMRKGYRRCDALA